MPRMFRDSLISVLSACLIYSPLISLKTANAAPVVRQSSKVSKSPPLLKDLAGVAALTTLWGNIAAWVQGGPNLNTMSSNAPQLPNTYQQTGTLPPPSYNDPAPINTANYDDLLSAMPFGGDAVGVAGNKPKEAVDPTAGLATIGGWSYNLDSGNYDFKTTVLSMPGRTGMGINLLASYNGKVWSLNPAFTAIAFNPDRGFPAPGWRIGFGAIQAKTNTGGSYYNIFTFKQSFIYIEPDGTRHDLAYNSSTGFYESYDSSYLRFNPSSRVLQMPNGTRVHFQVDAMNNSVNQFLPNYVIDRNGNHINIYYQTLSNGAVVIQYITDTAGRRIDFNYQNNRLVSISQNRNGTNFYFLRIDYQPVTIQTNFTMTTDPANINGTQVYFPVRLTYPTGVNFRFGYTSYGQVNSIQRWVPAITGQGAERMIASLSLNLPGYSQSSPQTNCPRFSQRTDWAENWQGGVAQSYQYTYWTADGHIVTDPLDRVFKVYNNGPTQTVTLIPPSGGGHVKKDEVTYVSSESHVPYPSNFHVSEIKTIDSASNGKRTTLSYVQRDGVWLPEWKDEFEYSSGALLRRTGFTYTSYPAQYVLGLLQQTSVHNGSYSLIHRIRNNYDEIGTYVDSNNQTASYFIDATGEGVIQHDNANYGAGLTARGNVTSVTQYKVEGGAVTGSRIIKRTSYDTNGNVRAVTDGAGNRQQFQFGDYCVNKPGGVGQTHLIPYTQADPTGFRKGSQWDYLTGLTVKTFNLTPGSSIETQVVTMSYDFADRPLQTTRSDGGWVKTEYWDNWLAKVASQLFETGKTQHKFEEYDGAGRVRRKASDHPDGAEGKFSGQVFVFDKLGSVEDSSNIIAINGSWIPSYEDAGTGFLFTRLTRDDLRRMKIITFPDDNTRQFDYTGCSCAGISETRITDEMGHYTMTKTDALGRLLEATEPAGETYVYSKAKYVYDAMDRVLEIDHSGNHPSNSSGPTQSRYFTYDGYGRLIQENTPEAGVVTYTYTANDLPQTKTDARGVTTTYIYNTRNLVTSIGYSDGTSSVAFTHDDFGARQTMADAEGSTSYVYNGLRQLQSETRLFTGLIGKYHTLNYTYNLADQPKSVNYSVSESSGYMLRPEPTSPSRDASARVATLIGTDNPTTETAVEARESLVERTFEDAIPTVLASALKSGQRARWRSSPAEKMSPRIIKTALVRKAVRHSAPPPINISGAITTAQGAGIEGVTVTVAGDPFGPLSTSTGSDGNYSFFYYLSSGYTYTVTPSKTGYVFNPPSRTYPSLNTSVSDANFTGGPPTYTISGRVILSQGGGLPQVTVTLSGSQSGTTTTNSNGDFSFSNLPAGNYTVTPSKTGYSFAPTNRSYTNLNANIANANFTATGPPPFTPFNKTVNYAYNSAGSLSGMGGNIIGSDPNATTNVLNSTAFRASGALKGMNYGNGRRLTIGYSADRQQPISMKVDRVSNPSDKVIDYAYDYYDPNGNNNNRIRKVTDNIDPNYTTTYLYDDYNRLATANASAYLRLYSYDLWGNITNFSAVQFNYATNASGAPATNRVISDNLGGTFSYDAAGNMTQSWSNTFGYDGAGRLKSVNGTSSTYGYDGNGDRVRQTKWDGAVYYVRSSVLKDVAMEVNLMGAQRAYVYSASGKLIAEQSIDGQFYWLHTNHLGSARAMTDVNGNLAYKGQFDPYGQALFEWSASNNTDLNTRKFTGHERDVTGLDYANARTYNSGRGRFMQADPMGRGCKGEKPDPLGATEKSMPQTLNRYSYVTNDPINFKDPTGLFQGPAIIDFYEGGGSGCSRDWWIKGWDALYNGCDGWGAGSGGGVFSGGLSGGSGIGDDKGSCFRGCMRTVPQVCKAAADSAGKTCLVAAVGAAMALWATICLAATPIGSLACAAVAGIIAGYGCAKLYSSTYDSCVADKTFTCRNTCQYWA